MKFGEVWRVMRQPMHDVAISFEFRECDRELIISMWTCSCRNTNNYEGSQSYTGTILFSVTLCSSFTWCIGLTGPANGREEAHTKRHSMRRLARVTAWLVSSYPGGMRR